MTAKTPEQYADHYTVPDLRALLLRDENASGWRRERILAAIRIRRERLPNPSD